MKLEYQEIFTKTVFKEDVEYVIRAVKEIHSESYGWEIGEPKIIPVDDRNVKIEIPLKNILKKELDKFSSFCLFQSYFLR